MFQQNRPQQIREEKNIFCMPVTVAVKERITEPHILISVANPSHNLEFPENRARIGLLRTYFGDVLDPTRDGSHPFTIGHADSIASFVEKYRDKVNVVAAHCSYGQSRSPAIVIALNRWLNRDDSALSERYPGFNRLVEKTLLAVIYDRYNTGAPYKVDENTRHHDKAEFMSDLSICHGLASRMVPNAGHTAEGNTLGGSTRVTTKDGAHSIEFRTQHFTLGLTMPAHGAESGTLTLNNEPLFQGGTFYPPGDLKHALLLEHHISRIPRFLATQAEVLRRGELSPSSLKPAWEDKSEVGAFLSYLGCFA